jgi:membrane-bound inhibitor of C-type lysozyme
MKKNITIVLLIIIIIIISVWYFNKNKNQESTGPQLTLINEVVYNCNDNKAIQAAFYEGELIPVEPGEPPIPTGKVKLILSDGRNFDLPQTLSASGIRYANDDESFVFWSKGDGAIILENGVEKDFKECVVKDESEAQSIKILSPNGGEVWSKGEKVKILWEAKESIKSVDIRLGVFSDGEGQTFNALVVSNILNNGEYEWTVQDLYAEVLGIKDLPVSDKYFILIEDNEHNDIFDKSNQLFSIK